MICGFIFDFQPILFRICFCFVVFQMLQHVGTSVSCEVRCAPLKSLLRTSEKVLLDYDGDFRKLSDLVRGKIVCESIESLISALEMVMSLDPGLQQHLGPLNLPPPRDDPFMHIRIVSAKNRLGKCAERFFFCMHPFLKNICLFYFSVSVAMFYIVSVGTVNLKVHFFRVFGRLFVELPHGNGQHGSCLRVANFLKKSGGCPRHPGRPRQLQVRDSDIAVSFLYK
jgi:hypothetical protein